LSGLLQPEPELRMTLDQLLLEPWVSQSISLAEYSWNEVVPDNRGKWIVPRRSEEIPLYFVFSPIGR